MSVLRMKILGQNLEGSESASLEWTSGMPVFENLPVMETTCAGNIGKA